MKTRHWILIAAALVVIGGGVAGLLIPTSPSHVEKPATESNKVANTVTDKPQVHDEPSPPTANEPAQVAVSSSPAEHAKQPEAAQEEPALRINGYEVQDPMARLALSQVGTDPAAEAYWIGAINDNSLPPEERKDLIEDLNEDGLSDPRHPTAQDMPVIASRIRLIEQVAPNAIDKVNQDAFKEAYKDLVDLLNGREPQ